jgi:hypothetical protein
MTWRREEAPFESLLTLLKANPAAQLAVSLGLESHMQLVACSLRTMRSPALKKALHTCGTCS